MFKDYVDELIKKDFIKLEITDEKRFFIITKKGNDFLQEYKMIENFVSNFGL